MTLGFASEKTLKDLKKDDGIEESDAKHFRLDCRTFLTQMMKKIIEKESFEASSCPVLRNF